jgi:hypothetical protein
MTEVNEEALQPLTSKRLTKMVIYLSKVRLMLASDSTDDKLQKELLKQEALNLEFMIRDLLLLRRQKILNLVLARRLLSEDQVTMNEVDFYRKTKFAFDNHNEFVESSLAGASTIPQSDTGKDLDSSAGTEYVTVRFLKDIDNAFMGLDGLEHGPFKKENVAMIPYKNAMNLSQDGAVSRVIFEDEAVRSGE